MIYSYFAHKGSTQGLRSFGSIHRACFPTPFGKQAFLVDRPIFNGLRSPDMATKKEARTIQTAGF